MKTFGKLALTVAIGLTACVSVFGQEKAEEAVPGVEGGEIYIRAIDVKGNYEVDDETILGVVSSAVGEALSTKTLEEDLQRIFDLGFFSEDVRVTLDEYGDGAKVVFHVVENPVVESIILEGNTQIDSPELKALMKTREKEILNGNRLKEDVSAVEKKYQDAGYRAARVIDVGVDAGRNLRIVIAEGVVQEVRVVYLETDEETGEKEEFPTGKTKDYVILREMRLKPGEVFHADKFQKDLQRIFNLGFFEDISSRYEPGDTPGSLVLVIEVEEGRTGQIGFGAGYSNTTGLIGNLSYTERNLRGKGRRLDARLESGGKRNNYEFGYFEPWLDRRQTSLELNVFRTTTENLRYGLGGIYVPDYEEQHTGFRMTLGRPISYYTKVFVGFKDDSVDVSPDNLDTAGLDGVSRSITTTVRTDTRDNIFDPTQGRFDSVSYEMNGGFIGGDFDYEKLVFDLRRFFEVRKRQVMGMRALVALSKDSVPRFDWFDLGGVNTLRGYDEYQFAGMKMVLYNAEYRFNLSGNLSAVLFADAGNVWSKWADVEFYPVDYYKSFGFGLRLKIPAFGVGPVRLDYAIAPTIDDTRIHFGFGHMF
ncbi:MAG: BamA/TamA family outer membrane protein [bacterium]